MNKPTASKPMPIRKAIREVLRLASIAKDTSNRELYLDTRNWLRTHIKQRNTGKFVFFGKPQVA
jgi:hemerythrin